MGIVDFLQDWNMRKRVERAFKIYINRHDPAGVSVMKPLPYCARFQKKMAEIFDLEDYHSERVRASASVRGSKRRRRRSAGATVATPPYRLRSRSRSGSLTPESISGTVMSILRLNHQPGIPSSASTEDHSGLELSVLHSHPRYDESTLLSPSQEMDEVEVDDDDDVESNRRGQEEGLAQFTSAFHSSPKVKGAAP
jgi:hypothetical protein